MVAATAIGLALARARSGLLKASLRGVAFRSDNEGPSGRWRQEIRSIRTSEAAGRAKRRIHFERPIQTSLASSPSRSACSTRTVHPSERQRRRASLAAATPCCSSSLSAKTVTRRMAEGRSETADPPGRQRRTASCNAEDPHGG